MKRTQAGFTMIELVIVIVILGILAATALPRFVDLGSDARAAKANAALGAIKSAANLAHATSLARGLPGNASVTMDGTAITMVNNYPTANAAGIIAAAGILTTDGYTVTGGGAAAGSTVTVRVNGGATTCTATYTSPAAGVPPVYSGQINNTNC